MMPALASMRPKLPRLISSCLGRRRRLRLWVDVRSRRTTCRHVAESGWVQLDSPVGYAEHLTGDARRGQRRPHRLGQQDLLQPLVGLVALPEQAHPLTVRELLDLLVGLHVWEAKHRQDEWVVSGRQLVHNVIVQIQSGEPGFVDGR